ncbi:hypothetical protein GCM10011379_04190 [Filimonas zeae]|uniref:Uncharacterized protein n=1 Tax=Filimonas zeae TaxID=1737353 RepID=A0A917MR90_9BACT|nr:hypothetical protein GCM10011379_04190 [Filimonas zeae]
MPDYFRAGCVCAEKITNNYKSHKKREAFLKNKSVRKAKWLAKRWGQNSLGSFYCTKEGHNILLFKDPHKPRYFWKIDKQPVSKWYTDLQVAKRDIWYYMEMQRQPNKW